MVYYIVGYGHKHIRKGGEFKEEETNRETDRRLGT